MQQAAVSWSGGKDGMLALQAARADPTLQVGIAFSTVTRPDQRISTHGVPVALVQRQLQSLQLKSVEMHVPQSAPNDVYERAFRNAVSELHREGVECLVFGDLFLRDIREYRERLLQRSAVRPHFPLWGLDTRELALDFLRQGFRATVCTVDGSQIDPKLCGQEFDAGFLARLPETADPCGENGEFHTFVWDGPGFSTPIALHKGGITQRNGHYYCELAPA